jgi:hypothetical protein
VIRWAGRTIVGICGILTEISGSYQDAEKLGTDRSRIGVELHAYCLMGNYYHLLLHTPRGNLSRACGT